MTSKEGKSKKCGLQAAHQVKEDSTDLDDFIHALDQEKGSHMLSLKAIIGIDNHTVSMEVDTGASV